MINSNMTTLAALAQPWPHGSTGFPQHTLLQCRPRKGLHHRPGGELHQNLWEIYGKSMENHGFMGNLWKIYGKSWIYGKSMENLWEIWENC